MSSAPQMTIDDYKKFALAQAALQPPQNAPQIPANIAAPPPDFQPPVQPQVQQMANPMPNIQAPAAPQVQQQQPTPSVTNVQQNQGPIKTFLSQFLYGAGQGLVAHAGLETDAQIQQRMFTQQQQTQTASRQQQLINAQVDAYEGKTDALKAQNAPYDLAQTGIPGLTGIVPQKNVITAITQHLKNQGTAAVATTKADATRDVADTRAQAGAAHDAITAQVKRDVAAGNWQMAGARLRLAQAKANGQMNGTSPTAMRLNKADLANNAQHNLGNAIDIINNSPDLFGKIAGHFTTAEQLMGSDDPRIQKLGNELHAAAQASGGVHGLRSADAVKDTEHMWLNGFRGSAGATAAGLQATSDSLNDYINFANYGKENAPKIPSGKTASPALSPNAPPAAGGWASQFGGIPVKP